MNTNIFFGLDDRLVSSPLASIREYSRSFVAEIPLQVASASSALY